MKLIHCKKHGCHKVIPENVYLNKWKALGFEIVEDTDNSVSSISDSKDTNYDDMAYKDLKTLAKFKNINTYGLKKEEIITLLKAGE